MKRRRSQTPPWLKCQSLATALGTWGVWFLSLSYDDIWVPIAKLVHFGNDIETCFKKCKGKELLVVMYTDS